MYFLVNVFLVSLLEYFSIFCDIVWLVILHKIKKKMWDVAHQEICIVFFIFQYPIEIFIFIMWKSKANILWFLRKSFSFLGALLHNWSINFIYGTVCEFVNCLSTVCLSRSYLGITVTYLGISVDVKINKISLK